MTEIINKISFAFKDRVIRTKIMFILFAFLIFRLFAAIPLPIVDQERLELFFGQHEFLGMMNLFAGGGLVALSIVMFGVMPYITAAIIMQLMTFTFPKLKNMQQEEGDAGRKKIGNYSRLLSLPIAAIQAFGFLHLLKAHNLIETFDTNIMLIGILVAVAGSVFIMWIGELISEFGIGNGISLMVFASILAAFPGIAMRLWEILYSDFSKLPEYLGIGALFLFVIYAIVYITEAERPVPVYNSRVLRAGEKAKKIVSFIPIKLNQAGVIPIIFAGVLISFPAIVMSLLQLAGQVEAGTWLKVVVDFITNPENVFFYGSAFFLLVFFFTFFYTAVVFDPKKMSENLQKSGTFVPGVRPGEETEEFFGKVATRATFVGALFLASVAVLPFIIGALTGNPLLGFGGAAILIVVSVGIDLLRKINAQIIVRQYLDS